MTEALAAPTDLRVEHLDQPLGIGVGAPRLSWRLPVGSRVQLAYQLHAGDWDSGRVASGESLLVAYGGRPLASGEQVQWSVKVWTDIGESAWSEPGWWEMGLLAQSDWVARWVEPVLDADPGPYSSLPAYLFRHEFRLVEPVAKARLYATAHGIYELFLNGQRVGDGELTPGFTTYHKHLHVQTYDVTDLLRDGANVIGAVVSEGWFRHQLGPASGHALGGGSALLAQLHTYSAAGEKTAVATGPEWVWSTGGTGAAGLNFGQITDLREEPEGWLAPGSPVTGWLPVVVRDYEMARLCSSPAPPVRRVQELRPVAITRPRPDRTVVDLGQNINGWIRLSNLGAPGTAVTLTHGEALDAAGDVTLDNILKPPDDLDLVALGLESAEGEADNGEAPLSGFETKFQVDRVTAVGVSTDSFEPRHTTHGFRYVRVEGHPGTIDADDVTGVVVHTDMRRTGWFECSDERINRLHEAAIWAFRDNACDVPTDCPQRERAGWTGDWQVFVGAAAFLYDVAGFSIKWLRDLVADQLPNGAVAFITPPLQPDDHPFFIPAGVDCTSAGWGDAAVIVPWEIYRAYGDEHVLSEQWRSMAAWVDYAARAAREQRDPARARARPTPLPHEQFLWDAGFHWGEWVEVGQDPYACFRPGFAERDQSIVATAYLRHSARLLSGIAKLLGRDADATRYDELAAAVRAAWQEEFIAPDGSLTVDTQATHVRALVFELVPDELRAKTAERLVALIREAGTHVGTGFLSTGYLLPVLADAGHLDVAYQLLFQDSLPSWLTMIDRGATTIWEDWNGVDDDGVAFGSLNHYGKGAFVSFLHTQVAGIRLLDDGPAYRRFRIQPMPGGGLDWVRAIHDCPYGRIEAAWRIDRGRFTLEASVPPGTLADVWLPDGQRFVVQPGTSSFECNLQ